MSMSGVTWSKSVGPSQKPSSPPRGRDVAAVDDDLRAGRLAGVDEASDPVAVGLRDERAHVGLLARPPVASRPPSPISSVRVRSAIRATSSSPIGSTATSTLIAMQRSPALP